MLSLERQQGEIVEKILRTKAGYVRAVFLVAEFQGRLRAKLVSVEPISAPETTDSTFKASVVCALPSGILRPIFEVVRSFGTKPIPSPYSDFTFFNSQPTRAPSFAL